MANQAWQISAPGKLTLNDLGPVPKPRPNQVLVRVQAASLNYRDNLVVNHDPSYPIIAAKNLVPCSDGAGIVEETGEGSTWKKGDRVIFHPNTWVYGTDPRDWPADQAMGGGNYDGTLRRYVVWPEELLVRVPKQLTIEEACTIYTAGVTAWNALMHSWMKFEPGMTVLTQGTGGVSCYAIMIAAAYGAKVVATSSSDDKLEVAKKLGASHLINYNKTPDWSAEVLKVTEGKGVDIVVDVVGAQDIEQTIKATRHGGIISLVGVLSKDPYQKVDIMHSMLFGAKTIQAFLGAGSKQLSDEMAAFMEQHDLHAPVAEVFEFEQAPEALEALKKLTTPGKIVIKV